MPQNGDQLELYALIKYRRGRRPGRPRGEREPGGKRGGRNDDGRGRVDAAGRAARLVGAARSATVENVRRVSARSAQGLPTKTGATRLDANPARPSSANPP